MPTSTWKCEKHKLEVYRVLFPGAELRRMKMRVVRYKEEEYS